MNQVPRYAKKAPLEMRLRETSYGRGSERGIRRQGGERQEVYTERPTEGRR